MGFSQFIVKQFIPATLEEVWKFISSPANLSRITPDYMRFEMHELNMPEKMYPGMIIRYNVSPLFGIRMTWVTEITQVSEKEYFVDEQRVGPYAFWHHEHFIRAHGDGVEMTDIISYKPPFGLLGSIANQLFIRRQLRNIFSYREKAITEVFTPQVSSLK